MKKALILIAILFLPAATVFSAGSGSTDNTTVFTDIDYTGMDNLEKILFQILILQIFSTTFVLFWIFYSLINDILGKK